MKNIFINLIKLYQKNISPLSRPRCKYIPTCSNYSVQAFEKFGTIRGIILTVWRVARCNPLSRGGYDPVPEKFLNSKK